MAFASSGCPGGAGQAGQTCCEVARQPRLLAATSFGPLKNGAILAEEAKNGQSAPPSLDPAGIGAALDALDVEGRIDFEAEQVELFESSPLFAAKGAKATLAPVRARGRPPGSLNKTTDDWRNFFLRHNRSPLFWLGDLVASNPVELLKLVRDVDGEDGRAISLLDVIALQRGAAEALAPYLHRKQPIAIDAGEDKPLPLFQLVQVMPGAIGAQVAGNAGEIGAAFEVVGNEVAQAKSHDGDEAGLSG